MCSSHLAALVRVVSNFGQAPLQWPKDNIGAAAVANHEAKQHPKPPSSSQYSSTTSESDNDSDNNPVHEQPTKKARGPILSSARAGRRFATRTDLTSAPVLQSAGQASTAQGLATGVSVALGHAKEKAELQSQIADLRRKLASKTINAATLLREKDQANTAQVLELRNNKAQLSEARQTLAATRKEFFDNGYHLASQGLPPPVARPAPLLPVQHTGRFLPATSLPALTPVVDVWEHAYKAVEFVERIQQRKPRAKAATSDNSCYRGNRAGRNFLLNWLLAETLSDPLVVELY